MFLQLLGNNCEMRSERERERGRREGERKNYCRVSVTLRSLAAPLIIIKETVRHVSNDWLGGNEDGVGEGVEGEDGDSRNNDQQQSVHYYLEQFGAHTHVVWLIVERWRAAGQTAGTGSRFGSRVLQHESSYIFVTKSCTACYARCCLPVKWWVIYHQSPGSRIPTDTQG